MNRASDLRLLDGQATVVFRRSLLAWYGRHKRKLPWRESRDPYRIWLSEIMLQQTRVSAVIAYYQRFLQRFPTIQRLAAAREASVLAAWSGLGYYRRARMLHAAARMMVRERHGAFPERASDLRELPGVGRYTAAAIASIVFGEPVAVVDGNVERVLHRIAGRRLEGQQIWNAAEQLLDPRRPGDFNQAMMELGAVVCTPLAPSCPVCPILALCRTRGEIAPEKQSTCQRKMEIDYALVSQGANGRTAKVFLTQRSAKASLMPGMWELPQMNARSPATPDLVLRHSITVTDYTVRVWRRQEPVSLPGEWIPRRRLSQVPLTGLSRKILKRAGIL